MTTSYQTRLGTSPEEGIKAPCVVGTLINITLSGEQTLHGVAVTAGQRVAVMNQTDPAENGLYNCRVGAWERSTDFNKGEDVITGILVVTSNNGNIYRIDFTGDFVADTTEVTFTIPSTLTTRSREQGSATAGQILITLTATAYTLGTDNMQLFINGRKQASDAYTETSTTSITLSEGMDLGDIWEVEIGEDQSIADLVSNAFVPVTSAPPNPTSYRVYLADGVLWNPLTASGGAYFTWWTGSAWRGLHETADGTNLG